MYLKEKVISNLNSDVWNIHYTNLQIFLILFFIHILMYAYIYSTIYMYVYTRKKSQSLIVHITFYKIL